MSEFYSLINKQIETFLSLDPVSLNMSAILNRVVIKITWSENFDYTSFDYNNL